MKQLALILLCLTTWVAGAQDSTKTFHVKHVGAKFNGLAFSYGCAGKHRDIFIDKDGNADFYWGGNANHSSASFTSDTVSINIFKRIITPAFIDTLNKQYTTDHRCGYFVRILQDGRVVNGAIIDDNLIDASLYVPEKLKMLIKMMDDMYNRYGFPK